MVGSHLITFNTQYTQTYFVEWEMSVDKYEKIVDLALRRGFFWPSYEIYGGVSGLYDLGPLGALMKEYIRNLWIEYFVLKHQDMVVMIETPMITPEIVFKASGHLESFTDPIVTCSKCGRVYRADHLVEDVLKVKAEGLSLDELQELIESKNVRCPACGGELSDLRAFNLLFQTNIGPYKQNVAYLRPEAAQGMFTSFKRTYTCMRASLPLGIAQTGRVARNEISPRQGMIRLREFTIMEVEFFFDPEEPGEPNYSRFKGKLKILTAECRRKDCREPIVVDPEEAVKERIVLNPWLAYWMLVAQAFVKELGVNEDEVVFEEKLPEERAHYSKQTFDQLVKISRWGWVEVSGHAYRTDYDLSRHMTYSGQDLTVFKEFPEPKEVTVKKVVVDKAIIGKLFKEKASEVINAVLNADVLKIEEALKSKSNEVVVGGYSIPSEAIKIVEVRERVSGRKFIPHVVEPSFGAERLVLVALDKAYVEEADRTYLKLPPKIAPYKLAVFPLVTREPLVSLARKIYRDCVEAKLTVIYDESGSIGRRYARADEIGVPFAVTVDYQSAEDSTVTIRLRDTKEQFRIKADEVVGWVRKQLE